VMGRGAEQKTRLMEIWDTKYSLRIIELTERKYV
jgi:hypothetical protein